MDCTVDVVWILLCFMMGMFIAKVVVALIWG